MSLARLSVVLLLAAVFVRPAAAADPAAVDQLLTLLHDRAVLSQDVARHKWNRAAAVADPAREDAVVAAARRSGEAAGLDGDFAADIMRAQIEASKLVQSAGLMAWRAEGRGPFTDVPDLAGVLRPKLDALGAALMPAVAAAMPTLSSPEGAALLDQRAAALMADLPATVREVALRPLRPVPAKAHRDK
jgi:chorismate mutase